MKALVASIVATVVLVVGAPSMATANEYTGIGITGVTSWHPEMMAAIANLNAYGVPIHSSCGPTDLCVRVVHYSAQDGAAAWAVTNGNAGSEVRLNDFYDHRVSAYRVSVWMHELGHHAGLDHKTSCSSAMQFRIKMCGEYVTTYTASEQRQLRRKWA